MTPEQQAALVMAQTASMLAEMEAMKIANVERAMRDEAPAFGEVAFLALPEKYAIDWNSVIARFNQ